MRASSSFLSVPAILAAVLLAGCDVAATGGDSYVRVVNASMDYGDRSEETENCFFHPAQALHTQHKAVHRFGEVFE